MSRAAAPLAALAAASLAAAACREPATPAADAARAQPAPSLETTVAHLLAELDLEAAVAALQLPLAAFVDVLTTPYDRFHPAYAARFTAAASAFAASLRALVERGASGAPPVITVRRHYAGDAALSLSQARLRWALPVQAPSWLVTVDGAPLDTVWVSHAGRWYVLLGLDDAARAPLAAQAPTCAAATAFAGRAGPCSDAAWMALDAAMRGDAERVARACGRVEHHCADAAPLPR